MKKGRSIMLLVCTLACTLVIGIFLGRNLNHDYASLRNDLPIVDTDLNDMAIRDYRLDINKATKTQIMDLPGIGETLADRIIAYRVDKGNFSCIDDLMDVDGIGEKKLQQIKELIKVGG